MKPLQEPGTVEVYYVWQHRGVAEEKRGKQDPNFGAAASQLPSLATPGSSTPLSGRAKPTVCKQLKHSNSTATFKHTRAGSCAGTAGQPTGPAAIQGYQPMVQRRAAKLRLSEVSRMSFPDQAYLSDPALPVKEASHPPQLFSKGCQPHPSTSGTGSRFTPNHRSAKPVQTTNLKLFKQMCLPKVTYTQAAAHTKGQ